MEAAHREETYTLWCSSFVWWGWYTNSRCTGVYNAQRAVHHSRKDKTSLRCSRGPACVVDLKEGMPSQQGALHTMRQFIKSGSCLLPELAPRHQLVYKRRSFPRFELSSQRRRLEPKVRLADNNTRAKRGIGGCWKDGKRMWLCTTLPIQVV
uniref:Uncharacterized protein n=1 Tax=Psilocybe cubensis TaxID=181762 RepID=A0A8H7XLL7_PSICU